MSMVVRTNPNKMSQSNLVLMAIPLVRVPLKNCLGKNELISTFGKQCTLNQALVAVSSFGG